MAIHKISIQDFLEKTKHYPVIDVRSPGEFVQAHIPGAYSLPLFSDEERKVVGTAYKKQGKQPAIKIGLDYFGVKMRGMVDEVEKIIDASQSAVSNQPPVSGGVEEEPTANHELQVSKCVLLHCWRGGMRSAAIAWLLNLYGMDVYLLEGGYKAYRNWIITRFEKDYDIKILGGFTGSGKTRILTQLQKKAHATIDLEKLANHKGSAFGGIGQGPQPSQEMFENELGMELSKNENKSFWLEDESQRIGHLQIPLAFWQTMRKKPVFFVDIPFDERLQYIVQEYGVCNKESLQVSIERIKKRLGPLETKTALAHLEKDETEACFHILLAYYDKHYTKGLYSRENIQGILNKIPCSAVDSLINAEKLVVCSTANI